MRANLTKGRATRLSRNYTAALRDHLKPGREGGMQAARDLGGRAMAMGIDSLNLAKIHEGALSELGVHAGKARADKRAAQFFAEAAVPIEETHRAAVEAEARLGKLNRSLCAGTSKLAASRRRLAQGVSRRKSVELALKRSAGRYARLIEGTRSLQEHLRQVTRRLLSAQEGERWKISRKLNDEVAQTLLGINIRLLALKNDATGNMRELKNEIAKTRRLVRSSLVAISRFAREFGSRHDK
jgi:signal transduction histidine kinase